MKKSDKIVNVNGVACRMSDAVSLMDNDLCDAVHNAIAPCGDQEFVDVYCNAHKAKYREVFEVG